MDITVLLIALVVLIVAAVSLLYLWMNKEFSHIHRRSKSESEMLRARLAEGQKELVAVVGLETSGTTNKLQQTLGELSGENAKLLGEHKNDTIAALLAHNKELTGQLDGLQRHIGELFDQQAQRSASVAAMVQQLYANAPAAPAEGDHHRVSDEQLQAALAQLRLQQDLQNEGILAALSRLENKALSFSPVAVTEEEGEGQPSAADIASAERLLSEAREQAAEIREQAHSHAAKLQQEAEERIKAEVEQRAQALLDGERERLRAAANAEVAGEQARLAALNGSVEGRTRALEQARADLQEERGRFKEEQREERERLKSERAGYLDELERLNRRAQELESRESRLLALEEKMAKEVQAVGEQKRDLEQLREEAREQLGLVSGMTREEAREKLLGELDESLAEEKAARIQHEMRGVREEVKRLSIDIIAQAIQRSASEASGELSTTVVPLPDDSLKGRLIGRDGRNIRAFEMSTGVDLIIDDTPEAVLISSFNPIRRAIATKTLQALLEDSRINVSRIEEITQKATQSMEQYIFEQGKAAMSEAGVPDLKDGLAVYLGRMIFRSSYSQNVLKHSVQVAHLCGVMAAELGLDVKLARRCGLLHDIGKSIDREQEGTHVELGVTLARMYGECHEVIDAIAHHHDPENGETVYSVLTAAADAISAARPGARRDELANYTRRLEKLEEIATSFDGVESAYALQAGREVRVFAKNTRLNDTQAVILSRDIAARIQQDLEYPGEVRVTVIRETRATSIAR